MRKSMMVIAIGILVLAGCSSDGGSDDATSTSTTEAADGDAGSAAGADAQEWVEAFQASFTDGTVEEGALVLDDAQAACVSEAWVSAIGVDALEASGMTPDEVADPYGDVDDLAVDASTAQDMVSAFGGCDVDLIEEVVASLGAGATDEQQACAAENIDLDAIEALLLVTFQGQSGDAEFDALYGPVEENCEGV